MSDRAIAFIDAENILKSWQNYCRKNNLQERIDYIKLTDAIKERLPEGTEFLRSYFYDGVQENIPLNKKKFHEALQHKGIQLKTKILKKRPHHCTKCGNTDIRQIQKGVDVALATDILRHAFQNSCKTTIVVSGDEDYVDAISVAKELGTRVIVVAFRDNLSSELKRTADEVILMEDIFDKVKMT